KGCLQSTSAKGQQLLGIRIEEAGGNLVIASAKFLVPVRGELVIRKFAWFADYELAPGPRCAGNSRDQVSAGRIAELVALGVEQLAYDLDYAGNSDYNFYSDIRSI